MALDNKIQEKRANSSPLGYKTISFAPKEMDVKDGRTVTGYLAIFNNKDSDGDILIKGCFAKSLQERGVDSSGGNKIAHLWQHDMREPLGKYTVLREDDKGLYFECPYDDIEKANRALTQFKSGTLNNFSIGYSYVWDKIEYDAEKDAFICKELNLYEGSVVTLAANDMTYFAGMKSQQREDELAILTAEMDEVITGLNARKQYELRQIATKLIALASTKPPTDEKEALRKQTQPPSKEGKKSKFSKLAQLA